MKVLLVNHLLDVVSGGGTAERTVQLATGMAREGVECTLLSLDIGMDNARRQQLQFARLVAVPCINRRYYLPYLSLDKAREIVSGVDVVVLSGHWTVLNAILGLACKQIGCPYLFAPAGALMRFGRSMFIKWIYELVAGRSLVRNAASCIAITQAERSDFSGYGITSDEVTVIPNGINLEDYDCADPQAEGLAFRARIGIGIQRYLLFLGRLNTIKGPDLLVEAFIRLAKDQPDLQLVMAGPDDGMLTLLKTLVASRGLSDRVHFVGFLTGVQKAAALREATLLVIPSRREAMSIVVLEGGACGCPVVFTDACGLEDLARRGSGVMVEPSVKGISAAIFSLLENPIAAKAMALNLKKIVEEEYSWNVQAKRLIDLARSCARDSALGNN